jgi:hypothetical protein
MLVKREINDYVIKRSGERGSAVVTALCYKPEGHGFETRRGDFFFFFNLPNPSGSTRSWGSLSL